MIGWWSALFNGNSTAEKATDAIISTGDKLFYTDEEKADDRRKQREFFPTLLKAYTPFKIAQRVLAIWFSFLFGMSFMMGLGITGFNIYTTYQANLKGVEPILLDMTQLLALVAAFNLAWIMLTIIGFYFAGGTIESLKKAK
jgi:hypothetical protein